MNLNADISSALKLLEDIKQGVGDLGDPKLQENTNNDLKVLISILENPVFRSIVTVQDSLSELNQQLGQHPSILPVDFDITSGGELVLNVPPAGELYDTDFTTEFAAAAAAGGGRDFDEQRVPSAPISPNSPIQQQTSTFSPTSSNSKILSLLNTENNKQLNSRTAVVVNSETLRLLQQGNNTFTTPSNSSTSTTSTTQQQQQQHEDDLIHRSPSVGSDNSKTGSDNNNLPNSEWSQVENIELINDGTGLGFGIVGMRNQGVVVKTILPGGVADRDGRLQSGDHILQIGEVNLHEMNSEQVATVLRQSGTHVRLIVARPIIELLTSPSSSSSEYNNHIKYLGNAAPIVPTKLLHDVIELDKYLIQHKYPPVFHNSKDSADLLFTSTTTTTTTTTNSDLTKSYRLSRIPASPSLPLLNLDVQTNVKMPEMEKFIVELRKDSNGLGITIAGYVCEKEELSGIFVKSVSKGSSADLSGKIKVNDRIVEVDGQSLQGYTNIQAVEVLRNCGTVVKLCLERYLHGPKYEQLQQAIAASETKSPTTTISPLKSSPRYPTTTTTTSTTTTTNADGTISNSSIFNENYNTPLSDDDLKAKWVRLMMEQHDVVIILARLKKFGEKGGLGISLEGTVDVEDGREVRPHHYIRSILPEGPVGQNGILKSGDELLEVNGHQLLGMNHHEVVSILKELPINVCLICGRSPTNIFKDAAATAEDVDAYPPSSSSSAAAAAAAAAAERNVLTRSLNNLFPTSDRLVKAKSDGSLASSIAVTCGGGGGGGGDAAGRIAAETPLTTFKKIKSRSLEPLTGLAMWCSEPQIIELIKGERGLGFSILDYQDPIDPNDTVIVIRSLVPGGVAQLDGRLIPGDRLLFVNDTVLENASLDQAVQALKGAPKGIVRIGVAKPLPIPDSVVAAHGAGSLLIDDVVDPDRFLITTDSFNN